VSADAEASGCLKGIGPAMLIYDAIYHWEGWGGTLRLGSGKCRLRIFDLGKGDSKSVTYLKPTIVVVSDVPDSKISVRSCPGHIATGVAKAFKIDPHRMLYVEYYPATVYGEHHEHIIPERYDVVEFAWHDDKAIQPKWKPLALPMLSTVKRLVEKRT